MGKFREAIEKLAARPSQPPGGAGTVNRLVAPPSGPGTAAPAVLGTPPASSQPGSSGSGSAGAAPAAMSDSAAPVASGASGYDYLYIETSFIFLWLYKSQAGCMLGRISDPYSFHTDPDPAF